MLVLKARVTDWLDVVKYKINSLAVLLYTTKSWFHFPGKNKKNYQIRKGITTVMENEGFELGPIHTIPDSSYIGLLPISDRPSIHTIPDESDTLRIAFA